MYSFGRVVGIIGVSIAVTLLALALIKGGQKPGETVVTEIHSPEFLAAFYRASRIYGKVGCGDQHLAEATAARALRFHVDAGLIASQIGEESTCNPLAISNKGAVGIMQITPKTFSKIYDFQKINLFNMEDNMDTGVEILSNLIRQYGVKKGLEHYYGTGQDGLGLDQTTYAEKIMKIAEVK